MSDVGTEIDATRADAAVFQQAMQTVSLELLRADGWENPVLGIGGARDPSVYTTFTPRPTITDVVIEAMYVQDHFAAMVVEALPSYVLSKGWAFAVPGDPQKATELRVAYAKREAELGVRTEIEQGAYWGRAFGGALTWVGADDGRPLDLPLDESAIASVRFVHTFDRRDVSIASYYGDPRHPKFRRPETYRIVPRVLAGGGAFDQLGVGGSLDLGGRMVTLHETRCVIWPGQSTTDTRRLERAGWDDSIYERVWDALKQVAEDYTSKSLTLAKGAITGIKIHDLYGKIANKVSNAAVNTRLAQLDMSRSRNRLLPLDAREDIVVATQPLAGLPESIASSVLRLSSATKIPVTVLMGDSPSGEDASGESDAENWAAQGKSWRELTLEPRHRRIARVILLAKDGPTSGQEPEGWTLTYNALREVPPDKAATVRKTEAETDALNIDRGVYTADVAAHRYGPTGAAGVQLDPEELRDRVQRRRELAKQPPKDNAELGTVGARATAASDLVEKVVAGELPRESAQALLVELFRFTPEVAAQILGPKDFVARPAQPKGVPGPAPDPKFGEGKGAPLPSPGFNEGGDPR